jgi:hypothetical protein
MKYDKVTPTKKIGDYDAWVGIEGNMLWVEWNWSGATSRTSIRSEWFNPVNVEKGIYSTLTNWNELDEILEGWGVKPVAKKSWISDWGNHDTDKFTNTAYDFSSVIAAMV